jgi:hypothetical protein
MGNTNTTTIGPLKITPANTFEEFLVDVKAVNEKYRNIDWTKVTHNFQAS